MTRRGLTGKMGVRVLHLCRRGRARNFSVERLYDDLRHHMPEGIEVRTVTSRFFSNGVWRRLYDALRVSWLRADVYHVTGDVHYLTYFLRSRRTLLTILDCIPLDRHSGLKYWLFWVLWYWLPEKRSAAIVVISRATRDRLLHFLNCDPGKIHVIHCHVSAEFLPRPKRFAHECPRLLHVGTGQNKNLERHIAALSGLNCVLVIIGELSSGQRLALAKSEIRFENHVALSREALVAQYEACDLLLFASTYEGFGLPIVEAQAVGRPVVTSKLLSMPEVAGGAACLVDPFDVQSISAGVRRIIDDQDYRDMLIRLGFLNVERFRIDKIAQQYADLYRELALVATG